MSNRVYLDNAATSWPKPEAVYQAVDRYQREIGAAAGRGAYAEALEAARIVADARLRASRLIEAEAPRQIIFSANGTDALNTALYAVLRPGDHVITSVLEHNSVLRPLRHLEEEGRISVTRVECGGNGTIDPDAVARAMQPETALVALVHASNVTGALQPVAEVGQIARRHGALLLVDAAQTLGHLPVSVQQLGADLLAAPGHKGLLGPLGTGLLYIRPAIEARLRSVRQGGTGSRSEDDRQPDVLPDKFEAGNLNLPGLAGLAASLAWLEERGLASLRSHEQQLLAQLRTGLQGMPTVRLYGPDDPEQGVGVLSLTVEGYDPQELAMLLDMGHGVQARAGIHCAPLAHGALGTLHSGGTLRLSLGPFNTAEHVDRAVQALRELAEGASIQ